MGIERIVSTTVSEDDKEEEIIERSLRPLTFDEYIGQDRMKNNLKIAIDAVKKRKQSGSEVFSDIGDNFLHRLTSFVYTYEVL